MANKLYVNFDDLNSAIDMYESSIDDFKDMIKNLDGVINNLKDSEWKSDAATAYFETYDNGWKVNMEKHILILEHLKDCLVNARNDYGELADDASEMESALQI